MIDADRNRDLIRNTGVGAGLLLGMPFPTLYAFQTYPDHVHFQCRSFDDGALHARAWGLTEYSYRTNDKGSEFHEWSGRVNGSKVSIVATPEHAVGPQPAVVALEEFDPVEALRALAEGG